MTIANIFYYSVNLVFHTVMAMSYIIFHDRYVSGFVFHLVNTYYGHNITAVWTRLELSIVKKINVNEINVLKDNKIGYLYIYNVRSGLL